MEAITIHTGLNGFVMIDAVTDLGPDFITGEVRFSDADPTLLLESLAQIAGLHIRHALHFSRHAFLAKIARIPLPGGEPLNGRYHLRGQLIGHSENAFTYQLEASRDGHPVVQGRFLFGTIDYNDDFQKEILQKHYQKVFTCLRNG